MPITTTAARTVSNNHGHAAPAPIVAAIVLHTQNPPTMIASPRIQRTTRIVPIISVEFFDRGLTRADICVKQIATAEGSAVLARPQRTGFFVVRKSVARNRTADRFSSLAKSLRSPVDRCATDFDSAHLE